jgi:hypothetical protein
MNWFDKSPASFLGTPFSRGNWVNSPLKRGCPEGGGFNSKSTSFLPFLITTFFLFSSCDKGFEDLQNDPTQPSSVNPEFLFTESVRRGMSDDIVGIRTEIWTLMVWNQQMADIRGVSTQSDFYNYGAAASDDIWDRWFVGALTNIQEMIRLTEDKPSEVNKLAVARIWKAYLYHRITDLWGDVPYSEALQANTEAILLSPKYDTQREVYSDLLKELKEAAESFDPQLEDVGAADPLFGGDIIGWKRFANSLRLRLAIRISAADPILARQHGEEVVNSGLLISNEMESVRFPHNSNNGLAIFQLFNTLVDDDPVIHYYPSEFFINHLESRMDPRLAFFSNPTEESQIFGFDDFVGIPNLKLNTDLESFNPFNTSQVDGRFYDEPMESNTLSYSEVCFLQAEAALLGWGGSQQERYEAGVTASMAYFAIDQADITDYLANAGAFDGSLEQIITEKWIGFQYRDGFEPFAEYRRTGFPKLLDENGAVIDPNTFPQRLPYPESEIFFNNANVSAVGEGINETSTKVWWAE